MKRSSLYSLALILMFASACGYIQQKPEPLTENQGAPDTTPIYQYDGWIIARASVHNHTTFSDGCRTPEDLVRQARNEGLAVLAVTDHREGQICVGNKKSKGVCVDMGGIDTKKRGYRKYFDEIGKLAAESKSPLILLGMEVGPYFWNTGVAPYFNFTGVHWHFTTYGIDDPAIYEKMPVRKQVMDFREPDPGLKPYIEWVDYMVKNGALVFQAHPEGTDYGKYYTAMLLAGAPTQFTDKIPSLTGVAIIPEGFTQVGRPGGEWDTAQLQYMAGIRKAPLWGWGEADFHCPPDILRHGTTMFYVKNLAKDDILSAMKTGKMVALMGQDFQDIYVTEFSVGDGKPATDKIMFGQSVKISGPAVVRFSTNKDAPGQEVRLIRSGKVIYTSKSSKFEFRDDEAAKNKDKVFYRVEVEGQGPMEIEKGNRLFTNPIFVNWDK